MLNIWIILHVEYIFTYLQACDFSGFFMISGFKKNLPLPQNFLERSSLYFSKPLVSSLWGCGESVHPPKLNIQEVQGALSSRPKWDPARYPFFRIFYFRQITPLFLVKQYAETFTGYWLVVVVSIHSLILMDALRDILPKVYIGLNQRIGFLSIPLPPKIIILKDL